MKILGWSLSYWHNAEQARTAGAGIMGLAAWEERMNTLFGCHDLFLASGTWSDPLLTPISHPIINAGAPFDSPYEGHYRSYSKCAFTAAMAYALNRNDWDLLLMMDTDTLIGDVNLDALIREFEQRPEILCCPQTRGNPEGPLCIWKREAAVRMLHYRRTANLLDFDQERNIVWEEECGYIFRNGRWWNPWPHIAWMEHKGQDEGEINWQEMLTWPMVVKPTQKFASLWIERNACKTKPYKP